MPRDVEPVLLIEDTPSLSDIYAAYLTRAGFGVDRAMTAAEARRRYAAHRYPVVLLDLQLPDGDGLALLEEMRHAAPEVRAVIITANGSINRAVEAMRAGAFDFLVKPFDEARLMKAVEQAFISVEDSRRNPAPLPVPGERFQGFTGSSPPMRDVFETIRDVARSSATVFITGESGTGKEVCAQAVHALSTRRDGPFVPLNCGAIPRDLLESEVFGHLRGSFTGAIADKTGAAAAADGGTLFLDEICEMDIDLQTKLLRFLQTSTIQPVGATTPRKVDVRIVCATNRNPQTEVDAGRFRADLFYRLFVVPIHLPALRERGRDVLEIGRDLLLTYAQEEGKAFHGLSPEVEACFLAYPWPGNIRELQNVLRNIAVLRDGPNVTVQMLPQAIAQARPAPGVTEAATSLPPTDTAERRRRILTEFVGIPLETLEREYIETTIDACDGSVTRAARLLDVSPSTLYRKREAWKRGMH
jgi:DNA-binding NtrC family response regulator